MRTTPIAAALASCLIFTAACAQPALDSDRDKTLYALGIAIGTNVEVFQLTEDELEIVAAGISDGALGNEPKVDMNVFGPKIEELAGERASEAAAAERQASADFLYQMAQEPGAQRSASGLVYIPISEGTGPSPVPTDTVSVHYHGTLRDGTVFDSSVERGQPATFALNGVIPCWTEALQKMRVGGKSKLVCPSELAYGDTGTGPIPGGAALVFEVELLSIE